MIKEACVENYRQAKRAVELGADRIELCDNLKDDGTTPSYGTIKEAVNTLDVDIYPIIRPRGGDFLYSESEISIIKEDIKICRQLKVPGIVLGVLNEENKIDEKTMKDLIDVAGGMEVTFHMAFDLIENKFKALDILVDLGVSRLLTKGGPGQAFDNMESLKELVDYSKDRIIILAGGGVREGNYKELARRTGVKEVHGSQIVGKL